jgi:hypothetical protein
VPYKVTAKQFLAVGGAAVLAHELLCKEEELISRQVDRWLEKPTTSVIVYTFVLVTTAHLLNWLPVKADPYAGFKTTLGEKK